MQRIEEDDPDIWIMLLAKEDKSHCLSCPLTLSRLTWDEAHYLLLMGVSPL